MQVSHVMVPKSFVNAPAPDRDPIRPTPDTVFYITTVDVMQILLVSRIDKAKLLGFVFNEVIQYKYSENYLWKIL